MVGRGRTSLIASALCSLLLTSPGCKKSSDSPVGSAGTGDGGTPSAGDGDGDGTAEGSGGSGASAGPVGAGGNDGVGAAAAGGEGDTKDTCQASPQGSLTFSVPSGLFDASVSVELASGDAGGELRYTLDRSVPIATSPLYGGTPLVLDETTELRAQAFVDGVAIGKPQSALYIQKDFEANHDIPVVVITSYGVEMRQDREYVDVAVLTFEATGGSVAFAEPPVLASAAGLHVRGQSSSNYDKKPYRLEFREADDSDRNCPLLGMPAEDDWVLHAPFTDKALIRNAFVYSLGQDLAIESPRAKLVELYLNTEGRPLSAQDYQGVYLLVEKIKNHPERLALQQLSMQNTMLPELTGGYIFKLDFHVEEMDQEIHCPSSQEDCWDYLEVTDPKPWVSEQEQYLTETIGAFVDALHGDNPADPITGYPAHIDVPSFVEQVIVQELVRNLDAYTKSQIFHKDRGSKIFAGPLWDYDSIVGVGTDEQYANLEQEGWQYESNEARYPLTADWFPLLIADPDFYAQLTARWQELRQGVLSDAAINERITSLTAGLGAAAGRNFQKWDEFGQGGDLSGGNVGWFQTPTAPTWEGQVEFMRTWLAGRAAWLDTQWQ